VDSDISLVGLYLAINALLPLSRGQYGRWHLPVMGCGLGMTHMLTFFQDIFQDNTYFRIGVSVIL
jgi:hypothetical protein